MLTMFGGADTRAAGGGYAVAWGRGVSGLTNIPPEATNLTQIAAGFGQTLALRADGQVVMWGTGANVKTNVPASATNALAVACAYYHNLFLRADGSIAGWAQSAPGTSYAIAPVQATNVAVVTVAASGSHSMALRVDGAIYAWGTSLDAAIPPRAFNVMRMAANDSPSGFTISMALRRDGRVVTWGLPVGSVPAAASNLVAVASGRTHALALRADGKVFAWGTVGGGITNVPSSATNVVAIATRVDHSLALRSDGSIVAWGANTYGQATVPSELSNVVSFAVAGGSEHSVALVGDGTPRFVDSLGALTAYSNRLFTLNALAVGQAPMTYEWRFNGSPIPDATNATHTIPSAQGTNAGEYTVVVGNSIGVVTGLVAQLSVEAPIDPPFVLQSPQSQTVTAGWPTTFSLISSGQPEPTYQWQFKGTNLPGANSNTLAFAAAATNYAGGYRVALSNFEGVATSAVAILTVQLPQVRFETNPAALYFAPEGMHLKLNGFAPANPVVVFASTNLLSWEPIFTNYPVSPTFELVDPDANLWPQRFYNAVQSQ